MKSIKTKKVKADELEAAKAEAEVYFAQHFYYILDTSKLESPIYCRISRIIQRF